MKLTGIFIIINTIYAFSQGGVFDPMYAGDYTVIDCFKNNNYKGTFKSDTIKSNYLLNATKLWRTIYLDNKENAAIFNSTSKCSSVGLFEIIKYGIFEKKLHAFTSDNFNETATSLLTQKQITKIISKKDSSTYSVFDANGVETKETSVVNRYILGSDIKSFLIKENWITNSYTGEMEKYVIGFAPLIFDDKKQKVVPLFWLYFPEWKELLASFEAKNYYSNAKISFYDVLERKLFISVISKELNLFDRSLKSTKHGVDNTFESELIKEKLKNSEEDLFPK